MPRSRGSDAPQRQSPRVPLHLKTTACSEANSVHNRPVVADRSPKVSPRGVLQERKRGTKVADLETKLSKAEQQLKKLRDQLATAEAAKLEAEQALAKAKKRIPAVAPTQKEGEEKPPPPQDSQDEEGIGQKENKKPEEESVTSSATMDVFEVVVPTEPNSSENEEDSKQKEEENVAQREEEQTKTMIEKTEKDEDNKAVAAEKEEDKSEPVVVVAPEILELDNLKAKLSEKEKEVEILLQENVIFKTNAEEEAKKIAHAAQAKEAELTGKLTTMEEELQESRAKADQLTKQLEAAEGAKATLEAEMKRLRVQTEQWRKAAEAAAAVLADDDGTGVDTEGGRRVAERCGSMDKHQGAAHVSWGSPLVAGDIEDDEAAVAAGGGRRKGAGLRMFGDLWKKKSQQK